MKFSAYCVMLKLLFRGRRDVPASISQRAMRGVLVSTAFPLSRSIFARIFLRVAECDFGLRFFAGIFFVFADLPRQRTGIVVNENAVHAPSAARSVKRQTPEHGAVHLVLRLKVPLLFALGNGWGDDQLVAFTPICSRCLRSSAIRCSYSSSESGGRGAAFGMIGTE